MTANATSHQEVGASLTIGSSRTSTVRRRRIRSEGASRAGRGRRSALPPWGCAVHGDGGGALRSRSTRTPRGCALSAVTSSAGRACSRSSSSHSNRRRVRCIGESTRARERRRNSVGARLPDARVGTSRPMAMPSAAVNAASRNRSSASGSRSSTKSATPRFISAKLPSIRRAPVSEACRAATIVRALSMNPPTNAARPLRNPTSAASNR